MNKFTVAPEYKTRSGQAMGPRCPASSDRVDAQVIEFRRKMTQGFAGLLTEVGILVSVSLLADVFSSRLERSVVV